MYVTMEVFLLFVALHAIEASQILDLSDGVNMTWSLTVPDISNMPHNNHYKLFHDVFVDENSHTLALLRWNSFMEDHPTKCNLTLRTHNFNGKIRDKICDIEPPPEIENDWVFAESVTYLKANRVLVSWREKHKIKGLRITSQIIFSDTCQSSNYIHVKTSMYYASTVHIIAKFRDSFDIIFSDKKFCPDDILCKLTFSYDGKLSNDTAVPFSSLFVNNNETFLVDSIHTMNHHTGEGVVLTGSKNYIYIIGDTLASASPDVYSPVIGWTKANELFDPNHVYSNSSGFATICWSPLHSDDFHCKWLDGTHTNDDGTEFILTLKMVHPARIPQIFNTPRGHVLLLKDGYDHEHDNRRVLFVDKAHTNGKCERLVGIIIADTLKRVELSIVDKNRYCFSIVTVESNFAAKGPYYFPYKFVTKCVSMPDSTAEIYITCGKNWF